MSEPKIASGMVVSWRSQSAGSAVTKQGTTLAFLPSGRKGREVLQEMTAGVQPSRVKGQRESQVDRYLVEVSRGPGRGSDFYTPLRSVVEAQNAGLLGRGVGPVILDPITEDAYDIRGAGQQLRLRAGEDHLEFELHAGENPVLVLEVRDAVFVRSFASHEAALEMKAEVDRREGIYAHVTARWYGLNARS